MATRLYLTSTANSTTVSPAVDASWTGTYSSFARYNLSTTTGSAFTTLTGTQSFATGSTYCIAQFISPPVNTPAGQADWDLVTGTLLCRWSESSATANYVYKYLWRLYGDNGANVYRSWYTGGTEYDVGDGSTNNAIMESRRISLADWWAAGTPSVAFSSLRIIVEIGVARSSGTAGSFSAYCEIGGNSGTDIPNNETTVAQNNPWFEMSNNITFDPEPSNTTRQLMLTGCGT